MTSLPAIGLQLYTVREALEHDFEHTIRHIADVGYAGVEPFGTPENLLEAAALFKTLGLQVPSAHVPMPIGDDQATVLRIAEAYGLERIVSMYGPEDFNTLDAVRRTCDRINEAAQFAAANGLALGYHNHWWELEPVDGVVPFEVMLDRFDPAVFFEIDVYWAQTAGQDPIALIQQLGDRAPLLHIKDGPAQTPEQDMVAVGSGSLDIPRIIRAAQGHAAWLIVELDRCATDMLAAVEQSFAYLTQEGLGHGR